MDDNTPAIKLSHGSSIVFVGGYPEVIGKCDVLKLVDSGIPGRSTRPVCDQYWDSEFPATITECIFCKYWTGADYEEIAKALINYEVEHGLIKKKEPFNRFAEIDLVM